MLRAITAFEASRRDFEDRSDGDLPEHAARWTLLAAFMERAARAPNEYARRRALSRAAALLTDGGTLAAQASPDAAVPTPAKPFTLLTARRAAPRLTRARIIEAARAEAGAMEDVGALHLTYTLLANLRRIAADEGSHTEGLVLVQQARAARHMGHLDVAHELYAGAAELGRTTRDAELRARAALGRATIANTRGNYPLARRLYRQALTAAVGAGRRDVASLANHGLMVTAAVGGDMAAALEYGWKAFRDAEGDPAREAEMLLNLAAVCLDTGQYRAALHGCLVALQRTNVARLVIPALATAIRVAAYLGERTMIPGLEARLHELLEGHAFPYERTRALLFLAEAYDLLGRAAEAQTCLDRGEADAERFGFFELLHRANTQPGVSARNQAAVPPPALRDTAPVRRVLHELVALGEAAVANA